MREKVTFSPVFEPGRQRNPDHRSRKDRCSKSQSLASFWGQDPDMCAAEGGGTSERDAALDPGEADPVREQEVFSGAYLWKGVSCFCRHQ